MNIFIKLIILLLIVQNLSTASEAEKDTLKIYRIPSITVTATRAEERLTPVPFTEITQAEIQKSYTLTDLPQFLNFMPSIITYSQSGNGIGYTNLNMRGFDQRRIAVLINGIPQNDPEDHNVYWIDFPDLAESLESIQIQRGAGMNIYGSPAIGGSINLTTSNFINTKAIKLSSGIGWQEYGSSNTFVPTMSKYLIEFSSGFVDNYAFYGRLSRINSDGYRDHSWANLNSYFFSAVRFDPNITTQINIFGGPLSDGLAYNGLPKEYIGEPKLRRLNLSYWTYDSTGRNVLDDWTAVRKPQEIEEFSQPHYEILNDWRITDKIGVKSAIFYYTGTGFFDYDGSWADTNMLRLTSAYGYIASDNPRNTIIKGFVDNKHGGWIPRLNYSLDGAEITAGAEIRFHRSEHWGKIQFADILPQNYDPDSKIYYYEGIRNIYSLFARGKVFLNNDWILVAEAQLTNHLYAIENEKARELPVRFKNIDGSITGDRLFEVNYLFLNPKIGINYNFDEYNSFYSLIAYTSREPRMRNLYAAGDSYFGAMPLFVTQGTSEDPRFDFSKPLVNPEKMVNFELGWNYRDPKIFANLNFYWMEYFDELVKSGRLDIFGNPVDQNAPRTRHIGIELQGSLLIFSKNNSSLLFSANATISQNKIIDYDFATGNGKVSLNGNSIAGFPDFISHLALDYRVGEFSANITAKYVGEFRTDNFGDLIRTNKSIIDYLTNSGGYYADNILDPYFVVNLNLAYNIRNVLSMQNIRFRAVVNNLLNRFYAAGAEGKEFFPAAERNIYFAIELIL